MEEIKIKYNEIEYNTSIPENWNELNTMQLKFIALHWEKWRALVTEGQSLAVAKMQMLLRLFVSGKKDRAFKLEVLKLLPDEDLYNVLNCTNFIFNSNTLTICPLPSIKRWLKSYYPPDNELANITANEFAFAEANYINYHHQGKEADLDLLIATLYRPLDKKNKTRLPFNNVLIDQYAASIKCIPFVKKQMILLWYMGCRQHIINSNPEIFTESTQSKAKGSGWLSIIMALAGDKFGTFEQTAATDLHLIFMQLKEFKNNKPKPNASN